MGHAIFVKEFEKDESLVVKKGEFFLSKYLLTAVTLLFELFRLMGACRGSIKHIYQRTVSEFHESHIV